MGLEILEEFRPITPIRTVAPTSRTSFKHVTEVVLSDLEATKELLNEVVEECHTPTSPAAQNPLLVCPPAPKKPRVARINNSAAPPSQGFFQVPHDLASVFVLRTPNLPIKKIKTCS